MQALANKLGDNNMFLASELQHHRGESYGSSHGGYNQHLIGQHEHYAFRDNQMSPPSHATFSPVQDPRFLGTGEFADVRSGMLSSVTKSGRGFRDKILAQLGSAQLDDSKFNSNDEIDLDASQGFRGSQDSQIVAGDHHL